MIDDRRLDPQPVGLVFLDAERSAAERSQLPLVVNEVDAYCVGAGRRLRLGANVPRKEAVVGHSRAAPEDAAATWIGNLDLDRGAGHYIKIPATDNAE